MGTDGTWLEKQLKFRDLKRVIKAIREKADNDGILDDLEGYVETQVVDAIIKELVKDPMYIALIKAIIDKLKK